MSEMARNRGKVHMGVVHHEGKPRIAVYWTGSCGGCDVSFLEVGEAILDVLSCVEIAFWPALTDTKRKDLAAVPKKSIDVALINGALRTEENLKMVRLLAEKSKKVVAYGACAHLGGIPGLANLFKREELLQTVYKDGWRPGPPPGGSDEDAPPALLPQALSLSQACEVDYVVPGCPPPPGLITQFFEALLAGHMPEPGHIFGSDRALCEECLRTKQDRKITRLLRPHELLPDPNQCLLDQGIVCLGPATRGGCGAVCPKAGMPCIGCLGPTPKAGDPGLAMISALASLVRAGEEGEAAFPKEDAILDGLVDPIGTLYKFDLALWGIKRKSIGEGER